jgi:hypothetical protein
LWSAPERQQATLDAAEERQRAAVAALDAFDLTHPDIRDEADAVRRRDLDAEVSASGDAVSDARKPIDQARPAAPGPTFGTIMYGIYQVGGGWANAVMGPLATAFMNIADGIINVGRGVSGDVHHANELYDSMFNQAHAELKQLESQSDNDWKEKMNAMRSLMEAHFKQ